MLNLDIKLNELLIPALYFLLFLMVLWRANGLHNLLRFLMRHFNVSYTDAQLKKLDDTWANIQLFRFITGVNVSHIEDARKIQEKLNSGQLKISTFKFIGGWGDIMSPISTRKIVFNYLAALAFVLIGSFAWYVQKPLVYDFIKVDYGNAPYYISNDKVILNPIDTPPDLSEARSKRDCLDFLNLDKKFPGSTFDIACQRLLQESDISKSRLNGLIEKNNSAKKSLTILYFIYLLTGVLWAFTLTRFISAHKIVKNVLAL